MSGKEVYALFCTDRVPSETLARILLEDAYAKGPSSRSRLLIIDKQQSVASASDRPGTPPLAPTSSNAFYGWDSNRLAMFLRESDTKAFSLDYFFIADSQTANDRTLLLVMVQDVMQAKRLDVETIPFELLHRGVWGHGTDEPCSPADDDSERRYPPPENC